MAKKQRMLYIDVDLDARIEAAAKKFNRRSGNEVAAEVLSIYFSFWEEIETAKLLALEQQKDAVAKRINRPSRKSKSR